MSKFSKTGVLKEIEKMEAELKVMQLEGAKKTIKFQALRQELSAASIDVEAKIRTIKDLQIRFGFKTEKDFLPKEPEKK